MKKSSKIVICVCFIGILIMGLFLFFNSFYNTYELSPQICEVMLGTTVTPESFVDSGGEGTVIVDGYTYAKVNQKGNLILVLSDFERDAWKDSLVVLQILSRLWENKKDIGVRILDQTDAIDVLIIRPGLASGLELSDDYTKVIADSNDDSFYYQWYILMGIYMQFFEGIPSEDIYVEYIEYNANGEVCRHLIWPNDEQIMWPDEGT